MLFLFKLFPASDLYSDMSAKYGRIPVLDRMWTYKASLGTVLDHFVSSRTISNIAGKSEDRRCISLPRKSPLLYMKRSKK